MKILQLFTNNTEILGSDGIMYVDGRLKLNSVIIEVHCRNKKMSNYPHKIADSFAIYNGNSIKNGYGKIIKLN